MLRLRRRFESLGISTKVPYVLLMGFGRNDFILPAHRPAFARLWHDALPFKWSVPEWHVDP